MLLRTRQLSHHESLELSPATAKFVQASGGVRTPRFWLGLFFLWLIMAATSNAQELDKLQGLCTRGGQVITTAGAGSTQKAEQVIPSCTVTVYVAGTLTPATIYADRATTPTPKANPFTANSAGEWFFYAAAGRYDVRLSGGSGSNTYPSPVTYGDFWISSPGSSQPGTATRLLNAYNAKLDGGCDNTGVTNVTTCLATALTNAASESRPLYLPAGTYKGRITVPGLNSIRIIGDGPGRTILSNPDGLQAGIFLDNSSGLTHSVSIEELSINGFGSGANDHGIYQYPDQPFGITIRKVRINNVAGNGIYLASNSFTILLQSVDVTTAAAGGNGIDIQGDNTVVVQNTYVHAVGAGKAAYRFRSGSFTCIGCNGMDPGTSNADWGVFGDLLAEDGADRYARVLLKGCNVEAFTGDGPSTHKRGIRVKAGSQLSSEATKYTSSPSGTHIAIYLDNTSGAAPGTFDALSNFQLDATGTWANNAAIWSNGTPFLFEAAQSPSSYWDHNLGALVSIGYRSVATNSAAFRGTQWFNRLAIGSSSPTSGEGFDGNFYFADDNTRDIGSSSLGRPQNIYVANSIQLGTGAFVNGQNLTLSGSASAPALTFSVGGVAGRIQALTGDKLQVGTTSAHSVGILTNNNLRWLFDSSGNFKVNSGSLNIGDVNGNRPAFVYASSLDSGLSGTTRGLLVLRNETNLNTVTIRSGITSTSYNLTLPTAAPISTQCLQMDSSGNVTTTGAACGSGGGGGGGGTVTSFSSGNLSPLFTTSVANATTTPALSFTLSNAGANTYFGNNTGSSAAPSYISAAALTKVDDTNVTLTLGGSASTSLLNAVSLTLGWTGSLAVARGGTGQTTYTNGQLLIGNTTGNTLTKATLTAGSGVQITNGTGSITIAAPGAVPAGTTNSIQINNGGGLLDGGANALVDLATSTLTLGTSSSQSGKLALRSAGGSFTTTLQPGTPGSNLTFTLPDTLPVSAGCLQVSSTGVITQTGSACGSGSGGLADPGANGVLVRTSLNNTTARTITGTSGNIVVTNGTGVSADPTIDVGTSVVQTDQANTYTTGAQDFSAASSLKLPISAGAAPATNGLIAYDSTSHTVEVGINSANKTLLLTDGSGASLTNLNASALASGTIPASVMPAHTGDVTSSAGSVALTIATNAVTNAKFRQSAGLTVVGRASNTTGDVADILATNDGEVLRRSGTSIGFGTIATTGITNNAVTNAKLAQMSATTIKGNNTGGAADPSDLSATQVTAMLNAMVGDSGAGGTKGLVPAPAAGDAAAGKVLGANGTWVTNGGAPVDAQYVTLALSSTLTSERVLAGTTNQITLTDGGANGNITLSTPQNIHTAATPQFARLGLGGAAGGANIIQITGGTITSDAKFLDGSVTWNNAGVDFNIINVDATSTASGANSRFLNFSLGGSRKFGVKKDGTVDWTTGVKQTFAPSTTIAGFNPGSVASDPSTPANGDMIYNTTSNKFRCYENGAWTNCISAGGGSGTVNSGTQYQLGYYATTGTAISGNSTIWNDGSKTYLGNGVTNASPGTGTLSGTDGSGTNVVGGNLNILAGRPTGNGVPGEIYLQFARSGSSGTTLQAQSDQLRIAYSSNLIGIYSQLKTSTTANTDAAGIITYWNNSTHGTQTGGLDLQLAIEGNPLESVFALENRQYYARDFSGNITGTVTINFNEGNIQHLTMTGNVTSLSFSNIRSGATYIIYLIQDATGGRTLTVPSSLKVNGGSYVPTATANARDMLICASPNGSTLYCTKGQDVK